MRRLFVEMISHFLTRVESSLAEAIWLRWLVRLNSECCRVWLREMIVSTQLLCLFVVLLVNFTGCASYRVGNRTLYAPDVQTVYVPMIESTSFRRDLGERLTEAVVKEIELKTPFKVVGTPDADSILSARMVGDTKRVTIENQNDDPRAVEFSFAVEISWLNCRRMPIQAPTTLALPPALLPVSNTSMLIAEAGQSTATAQQQAIGRLAQQIVSTMEEPW